MLANTCFGPPNRLKLGIEQERAAVAGYRMETRNGMALRVFFVSLAFAGNVL